MMCVIHDNSRLEKLSNEVSELLIFPSKKADLGQLALEILIEREKLEDMVEKGPKHEKKKAKEQLKKLKEIQKSIVKLYIVSMLKGKGQKNNYMNYIMSKYATSRG